MRDELFVSRRPDLTVRRVGDEAVVFNAATGRATSLDASAALVFSYCDGTQDLRKLHARLGAGVVDHSLRALEGADLIAVGAVSRRAMLRAAVGVGAAAVVLPVVASIALPEVAAAASAGDSSQSNLPGGGGGSVAPAGQAADPPSSTGSLALPNGSSVPPIQVKAKSITHAAGHKSGGSKASGGNGVTAGGGRLAYTGAPIGHLTEVGVGLAAVGAVAVAAARQLESKTD